MSMHAEQTTKTVHKSAREGGVVGRWGGGGAEPWMSLAAQFGGMRLNLFQPSSRA